MDWDLVRFFRAVTTRPQLGPAADALGVSPATVSRKIAELERQLGRELFTRERGGYKLTEFGEEVAHQLESPATSLEDSLLRLRFTGDKRRALVRVNTIESLATFWMPPRLKEMQGPEGDIDLDIRTDFELIYPRYGDADVAVRMGTRGTEPLIGRPAGRFAFAIFKAPGTEQTIRYVGRMAGTPVGRWADANLPTGKPVLQCDSVAAAVNIMESQGGTTVLPAFIGREKGWELTMAGRHVVSDIMVLRKRIGKKQDPRTKVYDSLLRLLRGYDFCTPVKPPRKS